MNIKRNHIIFKKLSLANLLLLIGGICFGCIETYDFESEIELDESILVIEATLTNELKQQQILLSRTFSLDTIVHSPEQNANVKVVDNAQNEYAFLETEPGVYLSEILFDAQSNKDYQLKITTENGYSYSSKEMQLTQITKIDSLYVVRGFNEDGEDGVSINVDSYDPTGKSKYYRYEYEETYKIIAPLYQPYKLIVLPLPAQIIDEDPPTPEIELIEREEQVQVCYNTVISDAIIITNTNNIHEDRINRFRIRFVKSDNYILAQRYSILVRQYVQSREAYAFYQTLKSYSKSESLFSENQSGFIEGNIRSDDHLDEKVVGFFEVSSVDIKRIYFNFSEFFPSMIPPYANGCDWFYNPAYLIGSGHDVVGIESPLAEAIVSGLLFYTYKDPPFNELGEFVPYILCSAECGDCTELGKTEVPDFWIE